ncbi:MAG: glycosyltransferase family 9 protein [Pseudomonadota bacterium]
MKSVCILRLSAIGDVTHVLPVVHALRDRHPDVRVTWIIGRLEQKLMADLEGVEFIIFDKREGAGAYRELRHQLAGRRFDVLLHMQVSLRANVAAWLVAAERRIGYDRERSRELHGLRLTDRITHVPDQHVRDLLASFLVPLDGEAAPPRWSLPLGPEDLAFADEHVDASRPTLTIAPCSSHTARNWLPDRYAAFADHVARTGWQVILCAGPSPQERAFADTILDHASEPLLDLTGKDTLKRLAALLGRSSLVLAPDTGPAHMANAMGTPVLGLYAATDPERSGPYDSRDLSINRYPDAAQAFRGVEARSLPWGSKIEPEGVMALITVDEVVDRFEQWWLKQ